MSASTRCPLMGQRGSRLAVDTDSGDWILVALSYRAGRLAKDRKWPATQEFLAVWLIIVGTLPELRADASSTRSASGAAPANAATCSLRTWGDPAIGGISHWLDTPRSNCGRRRPSGLALS